MAAELIYREEQALGMDHANTLDSVGLHWWLYTERCLKSTLAPCRIRLRVMISCIVDAYYHTLTVPNIHIQSILELNIVINRTVSQNLPPSLHHEV